MLHTPGATPRYFPGYPARAAAVQCPAASAASTDPARDIVSEHGLDALSMRALAERIEYSPATLYLYFRDKDDLLREVVAAGFQRLGEVVREQRSAAGPDPVRQHRALGLAYVRFALDNTAYFRVMFELPTVASVVRPEDCCREGAALTEEGTWGTMVDTVRRAVAAGLYRPVDAERTAVVAWALVHGLVSLYLSGHLRDAAATQEELMSLVEEAMESLRLGWSPPRPAEPCAA